MIFFYAQGLTPTVLANGLAKYAFFFHWPRLGSLTVELKCEKITGRITKTCLFKYTKTFTTQKKKKKKKKKLKFSDNFFIFFFIFIFNPSAQTYIVGTRRRLFRVPTFYVFDQK